MANTIKFKRASGSDPSASDLAIGEPGLRTDTAELFFKKDDGTVAKVSGGGGGPNFKYLELRNAANNGAASFPGNDFTLVTAGTTTAISPSAANTLLVSVSGVIQKPNAGTSTSGITGFIIDGSRFKTATNLPAAPDFIVFQESGGIGEPSDNTVTSAKIVDGAIVNADINASAAIDVSKLSGVLPLAGGTLTGSLTISNAAPNLIFTDTDHNPDFNILASGGVFRIQDHTNVNNLMTLDSSKIQAIVNLDALAGLDVTGDITGTGKFISNSSSSGDYVRLYAANGTGKWDIYGNGANLRISDNDSAGSVVIDTNLDVGAGLDVTGNITATGEGTFNGEQVTIQGTAPRLRFIDTNDNSDFKINLNGGKLSIEDTTNSEDRFTIDSSGRLLIGTTSLTPNPGITLLPEGTIGIGNNAGVSTQSFIEFRRSGAQIGSVTQSGTTGVAFNTSSDYRLKENVTAISDGITRLKTLKPSRFNFKVDKDKTVDGFLAHEVTAVPEATTGTKDEVDENNEPIYQQIDQSKLVPLLVAALQEAIGRIEALEAK